MYVSEVLKRKGSRVEKARPDMPVGDAIQALRSKGIGALVVCDLKAKVIGILSERDIVLALAEYGAAALTMPVRELMTEAVVSCSPEDDIKHAMELMTVRRFRHLPVMVEGDLVGIVSIGDGVKARLDEQALEVNVLRDYARSH